MYDNSNVKGCWSKMKSRIDQDAINTKVPINMDRKMCASKINNSIEKRTSIIENKYDCSKDHHCDANRKEINALDYPTTPATTPTEGNIFIQALEKIIEDSDDSEKELISEDKSMVISPDNSINTNNQSGGGRWLRFSLMSTPATSTCGEFQNALLGEVIEEQDVNTNLSH